MTIINQYNKYITDDRIVAQISKLYDAGVMKFDIDSTTIEICGEYIKEDGRLVIVVEVHSHDNNN